MIRTAIGVVLDISTTLDSHYAILPNGRHRAGLVGRDPQIALSRLDLQFRSAHDHSAVAVSQQRKAGVRLKRHAVVEPDDPGAENKIIPVRRGFQGQRLFVLSPSFYRRL